VALGLALGAASMQLLHAQQGIQRTILQKGDTVDIPGRKVVIGIPEIRPNTAAQPTGTELGRKGERLDERATIQSWDGADRGSKRLARNE